MKWEQHINERSTGADSANILHEEPKGNWKEKQKVWQIFWPIFFLLTEE